MLTTERKLTDDERMGTEGPLTTGYSFPKFKEYGVQVPMDIELAPQKGAPPKLNWVYLIGYLLMIVVGSFEYGNYFISDFLGYDLSIYGSCLVVFLDMYKWKGTDKEGIFDIFNFNFRYVDYDSNCSYACRCFLQLRFLWKHCNFICIYPNRLHGEDGRLFILQPFFRLSQHYLYLK